MFRLQKTGRYILRQQAYMFIEKLSRHTQTYKKPSQNMNYYHEIDVLTNHSLEAMKINEY